MGRRAKIVATIGPSSQDIRTLENLIAAGMDVARLNFSHGTHESHAQLIENLRKVSSDLNKPVSILQDLQGPKLRVGRLQKPLTLARGDSVVFINSGDEQGELIDSHHHCIPLEIPEFAQSVEKGSQILLDDGNLEFEVTSVIHGRVTANVKFGGVLSSHKGVNLPGAHLQIPGFTEKDRADLLFGLQQKVDLIALSFVRNAQDIIQVKNQVNQFSIGKLSTPVIAKLELPDAITNLDDVLSAADGVMVARGDLGVEMSPSVVPSIQKKIIKSARRHLKPVITATQMLDSMIHNPRPTRAEVSDVANAVFDGTDAVMLSGETASGKYPLESIRMMDSIIKEAEAHSGEWATCLDVENEKSDDDALSVTKAARELAHDRDVSAIAVFTQTGKTALYLSKLRPEVPIFAFTPELSTYHRLGLLWGVTPFLVPFVDKIEKMIAAVESTLISSKNSRPGQQIVLVSGFPLGEMRSPNLALLYTVSS